MISEFNAMTVMDSYGGPMSVPISMTKQNIAGIIGSDTYTSKEATSTNSGSLCKTKESPYKYVGGTKKSTTNISSGNVDKRVSLTVSPKTYDRNESTFVEKVKYVLGTKKQHLSWIKQGHNFYGLLYNALSTTSGIIFPYTPTITFNHSVNYEQTNITHSNFSYNSYKNTPPPTISLTAKFTADNRDNALHMLSAIWFLTACSKCEFGERSTIYKNSKYDEGQSLAGLPPPVLYLNGYDSLIDNIPIVVNSFNYSLNDEKHYVNLVLDMSKDLTKNQDFCKIYDTYTQFTNMSVIEKMTNSELFKADSRVSQNGINLSFWLPTDLSISINFLVQPNILKVQKQWKLDDYKTGLLIHNKGKNPQVFAHLADNNNVIGKNIPNENIKCLPKEKLLEFIPSGWTW